MVHHIWQINFKTLQYSELLDVSEDLCPGHLPEPAMGRYHLQGMTTSARFPLQRHSLGAELLSLVAYQDSICLLFRSGLSVQSPRVTRGHAALAITASPQLAPCRSCWGWCDSTASTIFSMDLCWCSIWKQNIIWLRKGVGQVKQHNVQMTKSGNIWTIYSLMLKLRTEFKNINTY